MAYSDPGDLATGAVITEAWVDAVRADILASALAIVTTKGDLTAATAATTLARLAIGADDSTLVAASGAATGLAWQIIPAVHVTKSDTTALGLSAWTSLTFDTETSDTDAMHSTVSNTSRLTVPTGGDGWYIFGFYGSAARAGNSGTWRARILLNATTTITQNQQDEASGVQEMIQLAGAYPLVATNYIEVQYYTVDASMTMAASPMFWAIWQRRT